jgi:hypothetical protein
MYTIAYVMFEIVIILLIIAHLYLNLYLLIIYIIINNNKAILKTYRQIFKGGYLDLNKDILCHIQ